MVAPRIVCLNCQKNIPRTYTTCPFCSTDPRKPRYEQYEPAERGIPWYVVARDTFHFNDGWGQVRVEIDDPDAPLVSVTIQNLAVFDEDPKRFDRIMHEVTFGPRQALALLGFLKKHEAFFAVEASREDHKHLGDG